MKPISSQSIRSSQATLPIQMMHGSLMTPQKIDIKNWGRKSANLWHSRWGFALTNGMMKRRNTSTAHSAFTYGPRARSRTGVWCSNRGQYRSWSRTTSISTKLSTRESITAGTLIRRISRASADRRSRRISSRWDHTPCWAKHTNKIWRTCWKRSRNLFTTPLLNRISFSRYNPTR